jgi:hypothetical protein
MQDHTADLQSRVTPRVEATGTSATIFTNVKLCVRPGYFFHASQGRVRDYTREDVATDGRSRSRHAVNALGKWDHGDSKETYASSCLPRL